MTSEQLMTLLEKQRVAANSEKEEEVWVDAQDCLNDLLWQIDDADQSRSYYEDKISNLRAELNY